MRFDFLVILAIQCAEIGQPIEPFKYFSVFFREHKNLTFHHFFLFLFIVCRRFSDSSVFLFVVTTNPRWDEHSLYLHRSLTKAQVIMVDGWNQGALRRTTTPFFPTNVVKMMSLFAFSCFETCRSSLNNSPLLFRHSHLQHRQCLSFIPYTHSVNLFSSYGHEQ